MRDKEPNTISERMVIGLAERWLIVKIKEKDASPEPYTNILAEIARSLENLQFYFRRMNERSRLIFYRSCPTK